MDLLPTPEQDEIVATVRAQLESDFDLHTLAGSDGASRVIAPELWSRCADLGWFGLGLEEDLGGVGYGLAEETLLFGELGRHATPGPFLAAVLGARVAALGGDAGTAAAVLDGSAPVALAEEEAAGAGDTHLRIRDLDGARFVLVVATDRVALLPADTLDPADAASIDLLVPLSTAPLPDLGAAVATLTGDDAVRLRRRGTVLVSAELAGLAGAAFIAFISSLTSVSFTAVQYAIFSSLMTLFPKVIGGYSGTIVDGIGYPGFFTFTSLIGVPVLVLVWLVGRRLGPGTVSRP